MRSDFFGSWSNKLIYIPRHGGLDPPSYLIEKHSRFFFAICFLLFVISISDKASAQRCGTDSLQKLLIQQHPEIIQNRIKIEEHKKSYISQLPHFNKQNTVITIPVVVHVLWDTVTHNISDAQILSQVRVLNRDYGKLNSDQSHIPSPFVPLAADAQIQFCLAHKDPDGNDSVGITRTQTTKHYFDFGAQDLKHTAQGGCDAWNSSRYLNIWVVPGIKIGSTTGVLGYAQMPGGPAETDGVVISYNCFGDEGTLHPEYNKGRTTTHEVGHWLNLIHTWGDAHCGNDSVADTPIQQEGNYGCPTFPHITCNNGPNGDMFMDFMDYSDDYCMVMFTLAQAQRMNALFAPGGVRESIVHAIDSVGCSPLGVQEPSILENKISVYPNPAADIVTIDFSGVQLKNYTVVIKNIYNEEVYKNTFNNHPGHLLKIPLQKFAEGLYIVSIAADKSIVNKKIVIDWH